MIIDHDHHFFSWPGDCSDNLLPGLLCGERRRQEVDLPGELLVKDDFDDMWKDKLAKLKRCASRESFMSKINQFSHLTKSECWCWCQCRPPCPPQCRPLVFLATMSATYMASRGNVICHIGHLVYLHVGHQVHLHVGDHVGHHNVTSTLCEGSVTLTEWKSESITYFKYGRMYRGKCQRCF